MARGGKREGAGRPEGSPNKATADVRKAIAAFAEDNVSKLEDWLERVAKDNPKAAADLYLRALEYHIPKLARSELTGIDGEPLVVKVVKFADRDSE